MTNTATQILRELEGRGANISVEGTDLLVQAPKGTLPAQLQQQLRAQKRAILELLRKDSGQIQPTRGAPDPSPPKPDALELGHARARFAEFGTQPAWDDLVGAVLLERQREWCGRTLEGSYRGELSLFLNTEGAVLAAARGAIC
jgi:hypothetical protein